LSVAEKDALRIALGTVPGTVREVVPEGFLEPVFLAILLPVSIAVLAVIGTATWMLIQNVACRVVCDAVLQAVRKSTCRFVFGPVSNAVRVVVSMATRTASCAMTLVVEWSSGKEALAPHSKDCRYGLAARTRAN
jgi:hypothetical protein